MSRKATTECIGTQKRQTEVNNTRLQIQKTMYPLNSRDNSSRSYFLYIMYVNGVKWNFRITETINQLRFQKLTIFKTNRDLTGTARKQEKKSYIYKHAREWEGCHAIPLNSVSSEYPFHHVQTAYRNRGLWAVHMYLHWIWIDYEFPQQP
jgi:hypothetical protein